MVYLLLNSMNKKNKRKIRFLWIEHSEFIIFMIRPVQYNFEVNTLGFGVMNRKARKLWWANITKKYYMYVSYRGVSKKFYPDGKHSLCSTQNHFNRSDNCFLKENIEYTVVHVCIRSFADIGENINTCVYLYVQLYILYMYVVRWVLSQ